MGSRQHTTTQTRPPRPLPPARGIAPGPAHPTGGCRSAAARAEAPQSNATGARRVARRREMRVDDAPIAGFLAEHHGRAGDEILAVGSRGLRIGADPFGARLAFAPDDGNLAVDDPADVERRPIAARDIVTIILPQPGPVLAALVGMPIE